MMKLFILLLAITVFGDEHVEDEHFEDEHIEDEHIEEHDYSGPCKPIIDLIFDHEEKCDKDIEAGTFVVPDTCSKALHNELDKFLASLNEEYPDGEFEQEEILHHAKLEYCLMSRLGHIKDGKFDYESFKSFIRVTTLIEDEKIRKNLISAINDLEEQEGGQTGFKEIIEADILNQIFDVCFIDEEHWTPTDH